MKWTYRIPNKFGTSILLMGALVLVLVNNLKERADSEQLKTAFESIYEDRLMAESYILRLAAELHQIRELLENPSSLKTAQLKARVAEIEEITLLYLDTKLTTTEEKHFGHFEMLTWELAKALNTGRYEAANSKIAEALLDLHLLSEIQVTEAQTLLAQTERIFSSGLLSSQFEIGLVILIGLVIQAILFASKTLESRSVLVPKNLN